jgi:hypothetical protein
VSSEDFAHDYGMIHTLEAMLIGDKLYIPPEHRTACFDAFARTEWSNPDQRPALAWAWITEVIFYASKGTTLKAANEAFQSPEAPSFCPPSYIVAPDGSLLVLFWESRESSGRSHNSGTSYSRHCFRFSAEGHFEGEIFEAGIYFSRHSIKGPCWHDGSPLGKGEEWNLPISALPPLQRPVPISSKAFTPEEAAEAKRKAEEAKLEEERRVKEAEEEKQRKEEEEKQRKANERRQRILKYFNMVDEETLERITPYVDASARIALQYNQGLLYEAKAFPGMHVLVKHPAEDAPNDPGERVGYLWKGKWNNLVSYMGVKCEDIMAEAGWKEDAPEELKFRLMTDMTCVLLGGNNKCQFLDEEPIAFKKNNIGIKFERVWFLKRQRFDCWWIHFWVHNDFGHCHMFDRVSFGFLGDTGEFQGPWTQRCLQFMVDETFDKVLTPLHWSSYDLKKDDKAPSYEGEESWPKWKDEMTPEK